MRNNIFITSIFVLSSFSPAFSQPGSARERQASEYKRLSESTQRAYAVPASNYSPNVSTSSSSNAQYSSTASRSNSSSGTVGTYASNYNPYVADFQRKQANYAKKLEAQESAWNEKIAKVRSFLASSGIVPNTKEKHEKFFFAAYGAGLDIAAINTVIKGNAETYNKFVARENGMNENFIGSTKKDCSGNCVETVSYVNGSGVYTGNTKNGAPHGYGTLVFPAGETHTGQFYEGQVAGGKVRITFPARKNFPVAVYEGGYSNNNYNGYGIYTRSEHSIDEAEYIDGVMNGVATLTRETYIHKGLWKNGEMKGKHTWFYKNGRVVEKNMDDPNAQAIVIVEGDNSSKSLNLVKYTTERGTTYEGEPNNTGLPYNGKFTFANETISEGVHDSAGNLIKGKMSFKSGNSFDGEFKGKKRYRGSVVYEDGTFTGEYQPDGVSFKVGRNVSKNGDIANRFFGPLNTFLGYSHTLEPNGVIVEAIYTDDKTQTAVVYRRLSGTVFTGMANDKEGYQLFGVNKDVNGKSTASGLTNAGDWVELAQENQLQARIAALKAKLLIQQGRDAYNEAMKWNPSIVVEFK